MIKEKIYKYGGYALIGIFSFVILCLLIQVYLVFYYSRRPMTINSDMASSGVYVEATGSDEAEDTWETVIQQSEDPEDLREYTGATCNVNVVNNQDFGIKNWTLRFDIQQKCILNGFWCGQFEVHQFRDNEEIVETVDPKNYDLDSMKLDHNIYTDSLMINLRPGDYLVYHPSEEVGETHIGAEKSVSIGMIIYTTCPVDLSNTIITFYNDRKLTDGSLFVIIVVASIAGLFLAALYGTYVYTYRSTKREVESLTGSVIEGLSTEYKSIWLIDAEKGTIQLVRSVDEADLNNAIELARGFRDYNTSIKYYINHYVDEKDRERVWNAVELSVLKERVNGEGFYNVYYLHHPYREVNTYFQMSFTRANVDNTENIILGYKDVDDYVKEDQLKKQQLEDALNAAQNANRAKSDFLANMSHEIRTPINAILGMDTMILREAKDESVKEYAKDIKNASTTLLSIINDILDFSKIESGKMEIVPVKYQLDSVINDLINMIKPKMEEKGLEFELNINPETPARLVGDEIRVKQIITNILSNASKYTKEGKVTWTVDYRLKDQDTCELLVSVRDTGIGIKPEDLERLFSPYERLELKQNRTIEGTGLGLNITQNLIQRMGSELKVESVYGEGSTFSFALEQPIWGEGQVGNHLTESYGDEEKPEQFHAPEANILVVDDVEMNLMVIRNLLKRIEVTPKTSLTGQEAVEMAGAEKYDIIFLDAMMPVLSGEETLKLIREEAVLNQDTPIIVLTANAIVGAREEYIAAGFSDYLSKPVNGEQLENMIQHYLPEDKLVLPGPEGFAKSADDNKEPDPVLQAISGLDGINAKDGITASGGEDTYVNVCRNFYDTADSRMQMIRDYYDGRDADNYAIQVHALKSSARLIGANELSKLALDMEMAGKAKDWDAMDASTPTLMGLYQGIYEELKKVFENAEEERDEEPKKEITDKKLKRRLQELQELAEAYDFASSKELLDSLREYALPDSFKPVYNKLKGHMAEVDYDSILKEIKSFLSK